MRTLLLVALASVAVNAGAAEPAKKAPPALAFTMKDIDGKDFDLARLQGKVVLFVNVASECGLTPQYKGLQALHDKYAAKGLVVLGVPANERDFSFLGGTHRIAAGTKLPAPTPVFPRYVEPEAGRAS